MHILVTGGTGFIGQALVNKLLSSNHQVTVISRQRPDTVRALFFDHHQPTTTDQNLLISCLSTMHTRCHYDAVINLAGEGIMDKRWSDRRKRVLIDSRIALTDQLISKLKELPTKPSVLINASAIGFYGSQRGNAILTESSPAGQDFPAHLCTQWEQTAQRAESLGLRVCILRIGVVLHPCGGALKKMLPAFRMGLGGPLGNGQQIMPWIHRDDVIGAFLFLLSHNNASGVFNATTPYPVTNREFTKTLSQTINRPNCFRVPKLFLKLGLGEASILLTGGQSVIPQRLQQEGFTFSFPLLSDALNHLLKRE